MDDAVLLVEDTTGDHELHVETVPLVQRQCLSFRRARMELSALRARSPLLLTPLPLLSLPPP